MICSCCGYKINGEAYVVENGNKHVCERCWNNPEMFFPEKIKQDQRLKLLSEMARAKDSQNGSIEVNVIKLIQKEMDMYVGKMKVNDILNLYELDKFKDEELEGYQRERYEERTSELVEYLEKCPLAIMPALLVSLREVSFVSKDGELGTLKIARRKGSLWIIDGQHRIGGFSKIKEKFVFSKSLGPSLFSDLMNYEFPVVFVDSNSAAERVQKVESDVRNLSAEDIERTIFFIVNKTQRGISPSLKDALLYTIKTSGIKGLSLVDKEGWRILGAQIGIALNSRENSPFRAKINIGGKRNSGKPVQLNSFVSSLEILFKDKEFGDLSSDNKLLFLEAYWSSLRTLLPEAFESKKVDCREDCEEFGKRFRSNIGKKANDKNNKEDVQNGKKYLLLTSLGIHSLHRLAKDILHLTIAEGTDFRSAEVLRDKLNPIRSFNWSAKTSPLSALGGMKGVSKAYGLLEAYFDQGKTCHPLDNQRQIT
jgi:DGQHR domain-containing protein